MYVRHEQTDPRAAGSHTKSLLARKAKPRHEARLYATPRSHAAHPEEPMHIHRNSRSKVFRWFGPHPERLRPTITLERLGSKVTIHTEDTSVK